MEPQKGLEKATGQQNRPNDGTRISPVMNMFQAAKYLKIQPRELFDLMKKDSDLIHHVVGRSVIIHKDVIDAWAKKCHPHMTLPNNAEFKDFTSSYGFDRMLDQVD